MVEYGVVDVEFITRLVVHAVSPYCFLTYCQLNTCSDTATGLGGGYTKSYMLHTTSQ